MWGKGDDGADLEAGSVWAVRAASFASDTDRVAYLEWVIWCGGHVGQAPQGCDASAFAVTALCHDVVSGFTHTAFSSCHTTATPCQAGLT